MQTAGDAPLTSAEPPAPAPRRRHRLTLAATALLLFGADLGTKCWIAAAYGHGRVTQVIPGVLDIEESRNGGAAFGIATGATIVFSVIAAAVVVAIVREAARLRSLPWAITLGLLLGGAAGNLADRIFRSPGGFQGHVVDWIYLHHWPVFNIADSGVVVGGILAVLLAVQGLHLDGSRDAR